MKDKTDLNPSPSLGLAVLLRSWRYAERLGVREAARMLKMSHSTLSRLERGHKPDIDTWRKLEEWMLVC